VAWAARRRISIVSRRPGSSSRSEGGLRLLRVGTKTIQGCSFPRSQRRQGARSCATLRATFSTALDIPRVRLLYACARKNAVLPASPSRSSDKEMLEAQRPLWLLNRCISGRLEYHTPPTRRLRLMLVTQMAAHRTSAARQNGIAKSTPKAKLAYDAIESRRFFTGPRPSRIAVAVNVTFRCRATRSRRSLSQAPKSAVLPRLKGHRWSAASVPRSTRHAYRRRGNNSAIHAGLSKQH